jgi:hypothetical protein
MGKRLRSVRATARVLLLLALACAPIAVAAEEASPPFAGAEAAQLRFRTIKVDVSRLAEKGLAPEADWLSEDLPARLRAAFAGRLAPGAAGAPTLVVRIDLVHLGDSGGGGATEPFGAAGARDEIEGVALVVAGNGRTTAAFPLFTSQIALTGGPIYERGTERRRVAELALSFVQWLPGQMGL